MSSGVRRVPGGGQQIKSITFGWRDQPTAEQHIRDFFAGKVVAMGRYELRIDPRDDHVCRLCR